jgi:conjugal transfer/entry exclusion protein
MKDKTIQVKLSHLIIGGIILLLLMFLFYQKTSSNIVDKYSKEKKEIDSLQNNIFVLKEDQNILTNNVNKQVIIIDSLEEEITTTGKELTQTRTYYGNKIKDLTSASDSELKRFFTERYK